MAKMDVDLDKVSAALDRRWEELSDMAVSPPGPGALDKMEQRQRIHLWQADIVARQSILDQIKLENGAAAVVISGISAAEKDRIQEAVDKVSDAIKAGTAFKNVVTAVGQLLQAADKIVASSRG
jgi:hypothetical protein